MNTWKDTTLISLAQYFTYLIFFLVKNDYAKQTYTYDTKVSDTKQ